MRSLAGAAVAAAATAALSSCVSEAVIVDAGTVTTVTVDAPLYDTNLAAAGGCDPEGCVGDLTRDGDSTNLQSRWSCKADLGSPGSTCSITYTFADPLTIEGLKIALYEGELRKRSLEIYIDGVITAAWTSTGTTSDFETLEFRGTGSTIELLGLQEATEWLSITEVEILVDNGVVPDVVEAGILGTVTTAAAVFDPNLSSANGCDPAGCVASLTRDGDLAPGSRWSCSLSLGDTCNIFYNLEAVRELSELRLALYKGATRTSALEVFVDGVLATEWTSSGTTDDFESIDMSGLSGKLIELIAVLAPTEWISIVETEIMVVADSVVPTPTPSSSSTTATLSPIGTEPITPPDADLQPVGLIPMADGPGDGQAFYAKDGDLDTSWTCTGDPPTNDFYQCTLRFDLFSFRHIKQIKIAASGSAELLIAAWKPNTNGGSENFKFSEFVTSSGTGDALETYDVDYFTSRIEISPVFTTEGQAFAISEVEFMEELQPGVVSVSEFTIPYQNADSPWNVATTDKFEWSSDSDEALDRDLTFILDSYATITAVELQFPAGETYTFELQFFVDDDQQPTIGISGEPFLTIPGLESTDIAGWQSFDVSAELGDQYATMVNIVTKGTGSGTAGWSILDARIIGAPIENPSSVYYVGSTFIENWYSDRYPDFVTEGKSDQKAIMSAICAVKKASFDGVDCVGEDPDATGEVRLPLGDFLVDDNIFMKSGVVLDGRYTDDDAPYTTDILLDAGAAGNTDVDAIIVMDGISDAVIDNLWIRGLYDPDTSNAVDAVPGLGSTCLSVTNSQNITCRDVEIRYCDGDAMVVRDSTIVNIDAGRFDDEFLPWTIGVSRGTGLLVENSEDIWVRRHTMYDNGVAGIHIIASNNFTFEATITSEDDESFPEGEGNVGSLDGQQPIEVIVESSSLVTFQDMKVTSKNDPVMTISADSSTVAFNNCGFSNVQSGVCVIEAEDPSVVTADDDELTLVDTCFVKV